MANETEIGKLIISLEARLTEFTAQLQGASGQVKQFKDRAKSELDGLDGVFEKIKEHWKGITAAITSAVATYKTVTSSIGAMKELGVETLQLQRMTGMTAQEASRLIAVAHELGISYESLAGSVVNIARRMGALKDIEMVMVDETGKQVDVFKKFGIEIKDAEGKTRPFIDIFEEIRKAVQRSSEPLAVATQFFRYNAREMLPLLTMSREEFKRLGEEAEKYGLVLTPTNVNAVRTYVLAQHSLHEAFTSLKLIVGQELIPVLTESAKSMSENIRSIRALVNEYRAFFTLPWEVLKFIKDNWMLLAAAIAPILTVTLAPIITSWIIALGSLSAGLALSTLQVHALAAAIGVLMGYELGSWFDKFLYKISKGKIDLSGMNEVNRTTREVAEQQAFLASKADDTAAKLQKLGFIGPNAMKDFNNAVKNGTVIWDAATKQWKKAAEDFEAPNPKLEASIEKINKKIEELRIEAAKLTDPVGASTMALNLFIEEAIKGVPITDKLREKIAELRKEFTSERMKANVVELQKSEAKAMEENFEELKKRRENQSKEDEARAKQYVENEQAMYDSEAKAIEENFKALWERRDQDAKRKEEERQRDIQAQEIAIEGELKRLVIAEKRLEISPFKAVTKEIELNEQLLKIEMDRLELLDKMSPAYAQSLKHVESLRDRLADLYSKQRELGPSFTEGMIDGLKKLSWETSKYRMGLEATQEGVKAWGGTFKSVFIDAAKGQLKDFSDYWTTFWDKILDIFGNVLEKMVEKWSTEFLTELVAPGGGGGGIMSWLSGLFGGGGGAGAGGGYSYMAAEGEYGIMHTGGMIRKMQGGGEVDTQRILATPGEFMQPIPAVQKYGSAFMEMIRNLSLPKEFASQALTASALSGVKGNNYSVDVGGVNVEDPRMASHLRDSIERSIIRTLKEYAR